MLQICNGLTTNLSHINKLYCKNVTNLQWLLQQNCNSFIATFVAKPFHVSNEFSIELLPIHCIFIAKFVMDHFSVTKKFVTLEKVTDVVCHKSEFATNLQLIFP